LKKKKKGREGPFIKPFAKNGEGEERGIDDTFRRKESDRLSIPTKEKGAGLGMNVPSVERSFLYSRRG